jgi:hypothetical protein
MILSRAERCRSPWNGKCKDTDIEVFIIYKGVRLPICRRCWSRIANSNLEWGEPLTPETLRVRED